MKPRTLLRGERGSGPAARRANNRTAFECIGSPGSAAGAPSAWLTGAGIAHPASASAIHTDR